MKRRRRHQKHFVIGHFSFLKFKITPKPLGVSMSYCIIRCFSCFSLITLKREKFRNNFGSWFSRVGYDNHFAQKSSSLAHISVKIWQFTYTPKKQGREPRSLPVHQYQLLRLLDQRGTRLLDLYFLDLGPQTDVYTLLSANLHTRYLLRRF